MRLAGGTSLVVLATLHIRPLAGATAAIPAIAAGLFLLAGLWTPIAGCLGAAIGIWFALVHAADPLPGILIAAIGAGLALVGPGAWSIDARLFGWKRVDISDHTR